MQEYESVHDPAHPLVRATRAATAGGAAGADAHPVQNLQRTAGNAAVVAELQREEGGAGAARSPVLDVVGRGGGRPLDAGIRGHMESALGADFSDVRVHDDSAARSSASAVGAHAYTTGNEIVFGEGAFDPGSTDGQRTLAHELTHVIQQRSGPVAGTSNGEGVAISDPGDRFEQEAERHAEHVVTTGAAPGVQASAGNGASAAASAPGVQREPELQLIALQREDAMPTDEDEEKPLQQLAVQRDDLPDDDEPQG